MGEETKTEPTPDGKEKNNKNPSTLPRPANCGCRPETLETLILVTSQTVPAAARAARRSSNAHKHDNRYCNIQILPPPRPCRHSNIRIWPRCRNGRCLSCAQSIITDSEGSHFWVYPNQSIILASSSTRLWQWLLGFSGSGSLAAWPPGGLSLLLAFG